MKFYSKKIIFSLKVIVTIFITSVAFYMDVNFREISVILYALGRILFWPNDQESFVFAAVLLCLVSILLLFSLEVYAEQMAIYSYYFIIIGIVSLVVNNISIKN